MQTFLEPTDVNRSGRKLKSYSAFEAKRSLSEVSA